MLFFEKSIDLVICCSAILAAIPGFFTIRRVRRIAKWNRATGTIVERDMRDSPVGMQGTAQLRFVDQDGTGRILPLNIEADGECFWVGDSHRVVYDPSRPDRALLDRRSLILGPPFFLFLMIVLFTVITLLVAIFE